MQTVSAVASIVLGVVFVVAGASKLASGDVWPAQARGLGVPVALIPVVPWVELTVGAGLVVRIAPRAFALLAGLLLVAFTLVIARLLRRGEHPACACFGTWSARPIGPGHIARNLALLVLAVLAGW